MANSNRKGKAGEYEMRDEYNEVLEDCNWQRIGNAESNKHWLHGDIVCLNAEKEQHKEVCVLSEYFNESKKQKQPSIWKCMEEAESNAEQYGKRGAILRLSRASAGVPSEDYIVMTPETFHALVGELQSFRKQLNDGDIVVKE